LEWQAHDVSSANLAYDETIRQLEIRLARCHSTHRPHVSEQLALARNHVGPTVYDWLTEIIERQAPGVLRLT
jgi:hypothetical protein